MFGCWMVDAEPVRRRLGRRPHVDRAMLQRGAFPPPFFPLFFCPRKLRLRPLDESRCGAMYVVRSTTCSRGVDGSCGRCVTSDTWMDGWVDGWRGGLHFTSWIHQLDAAARWTDGLRWKECSVRLARERTREGGGLRSGGC